MDFELANEDSTEPWFYKGWLKGKTPKEVVDEYFNSTGYERWFSQQTIVE